MVAIYELALKTTTMPVSTSISVTTRTKSISRFWQNYFSSITKFFETPAPFLVIREHIPAGTGRGQQRSSQGRQRPAL